MLQDFISETTHSNKIYTLRKEENYASVESQIEEDEEGNPIEIMCIWSSERLAQENIREEWTDYELESIDIREFLEDWCIGIFNDGLAFCLNIHEETEPIEVQPLDLAYGIVKNLKKDTIQFLSYKDTDEYIRAIEPFIIQSK